MHIVSVCARACMLVSGNVCVCDCTREFCFELSLALSTLPSKYLTSAGACAHKHTHALSLSLTRTHTFTHARTHTHTHTPTHTPTPTSTSTRTRTRTHTNKLFFHLSLSHTAINAYACAYVCYIYMHTPTHPCCLSHTHSLSHHHKEERT